jgi:hypothetical protein
MFSTSFVILGLRLYAQVLHRTVAASMGDTAVVLCRFRRSFTRGFSQFLWIFGRRAAIEGVPASPRQ